MRHLGLEVRVWHVKGLACEVSALGFGVEGLDFRVEAASISCCNFFSV